ncbi:TPA: sulfotransferase family 2 domain-containing protein [Vibrio parahaemolyticus]|nr:sulfotransferase family 2 domain-containing protein [Vibrio parahaemolyticus]
MKRVFKYAGIVESPLRSNGPHQFAINHTMMIYNSNSLYTFIPKVACSTMRYTVARENGCVTGLSQANWIHNNNQTFNATLSEALRTDYSFVILRCPFSRLASTFLDKIVSRESSLWNLNNALGRDLNLYDFSFRDFVNCLKRANVINLDIHWRPQSHFILYQEYDDYFSLENFSHCVDTLNKKINLEVMDARDITKHGTDRYEMVNDEGFSDTPIIEILNMKNNGRCPSHKSLYDEELIKDVRSIYNQDIALYTEKFGSDKLMF